MCQMNRDQLLNDDDFTKTREPRTKTVVVLRKMSPLKARSRMSYSLRGLFSKANCDFAGNRTIQAREMKESHGQSLYDSGSRSGFFMLDHISFGEWRICVTLEYTMSSLNQKRISYPDFILCSERTTKKSNVGLYLPTRASGDLTNKRAKYRNTIK